MFTLKGRSKVCRDCQGTGERLVRESAQTSGSLGGGRDSAVPMPGCVGHEASSSTPLADRDSGESAVLGVGKATERTPCAGCDGYTTDYVSYHRVGCPWEHVTRSEGARPDLTATDDKPPIDVPNAGASRDQGFLRVIAWRAAAYRDLLTSGNQAALVAAVDEWRSMFAPDGTSLLETSEGKEPR